jgi:hypothetical protein
MPDASVLFPADATWAGILLILVGGLFLAALAVGVAARAVMPEHYDVVDDDHTH